MKPSVLLWVDWGFCLHSERGGYDGHARTTHEHEMGYIMLGLSDIYLGSSAVRKNKLFYWGRRSPNAVAMRVLFRGGDGGNSPHLL